MRVADWKVVRQNLNSDPEVSNLQPGNIELYNLKDDPGETNDMAERNPDMVARLSKLMKKQHVKSALFPIQALDGK